MEAREYGFCHVRVLAQESGGDANSTDAGVSSRTRGAVNSRSEAGYFNSRADKERKRVGMVEVVEVVEGGAQRVVRTQRARPAMC